jgi:predicted transcriptional regulator of viral defense system
MKAIHFINLLRSQGRYAFTITDAENALSLNKIACLNALHRLKMNKMIASPAKGFYLIIPPEYAIYGCLPADMFVLELMNYWGLPYYTGFLSAAQYYGAAHQKPQRFQIVTTKNRPPIQCGRINIEFVAKKTIENLPTKNINTLAGTLIVASPEVLAVDLVTAPNHAGGINNVATILSELADSIDVKKIIELTYISTEIFWIQRLGWFFDFLGLEKLAESLEKILNGQKLHWVRLLSRAPYNPIERNKKWHVIVNTTVEPDE